MAESSDGQEKTEDPTTKKISDAREKGNVARSRELTTTIMMLSSAVGLLLFGSMIVSGFSAVMKNSFAIKRDHVFDTTYMMDAFISAVAQMLIALTPFLGLLVIAAIAGSIMLSGWNFSVKAVAVKPSKLNPISGLKRIAGPQGLMELGKALAKFFVISGVGVFVLYKSSNPVLGLGLEPVKQAIVHSGELIFWGFFAVSLSLILIAAVDVPFQLWNHKRQLKMTKQEVKQETKDTDGSPELKGRIRRTQMDMAMGRMMEAIPDADVIITNPTHFSVAIKYDQDNMRVPVVVAKGVDLIAFEIRNVAKDAGVPIMTSPALARAVYFTTEIDDEIPEGLYMAVARVLAYVFNLRQQFSSAKQNDFEMADLPIPEDMQFDAKGKRDV